MKFKIKKKTQSIVSIQKYIEQTILKAELLIFDQIDEYIKKINSKINQQIMKKDLRIQDYKSKTLKNSGQKDKFQQAKFDEENYIEPIRHMNVKDLEMFMEEKFQKITEAKPHLFNKIVREVQGKIVMLKKEFQEELYGSMKNFVKEHTDRDLTEQEISQIKNVNWDRSFKIENPLISAKITYFGGITSYIIISIGWPGKMISKVFYREFDKEDIFLIPQAKRIRKDTLKVLENYAELKETVKNMPVP